MKWQVAPAIPHLAPLLYSSDTEVIVDASWALSHLSGGDDDQIQAVLEAGVCKRLIDLLMHPIVAVQMPAVRTIGNIISGTDMQTQMCIANGVLPCLAALLASGTKISICKEACWTISNITAGNQSQIQAVIDSNLVPLLIKTMTHAEFELRKEAVIALANICKGGTAAQMHYLVTKGYFTALCDSLNSNTDANVVASLLHSLESLLRVGRLEATRIGATRNIYSDLLNQASDALNRLQHYPHPAIADKALRIVEHYVDHDTAASEHELATEPSSTATSSASSSTASSLFASPFMSPTATAAGAHAFALTTPTTPTSTASSPSYTSSISPTTFSPNPFSSPSAQIPFTFDFAQRFQQQQQQLAQQQQQLTQQQFHQHHHQHT
jgi:hypothetical protein